MHSQTPDTSPQVLSHSGGTFGGGGTFQGPGIIENGGRLTPGDGVGTLTWTGNLNVQSGGLVEIEIGGTTAGTQHDRLNVSARSR
jgi:hypothetical protein